MPRVYVRKFDWAEAKRLSVGGWTQKEIAAHFGVTQTAVSLALNPLSRHRAALNSAAYQSGGKCEDCGVPCTRYSKRSGKRQRCRKCWNKAQATSVRDEELRCVRCRRWLPDRCFPRDRVESARRGLHSVCRDCQTVIKREYREARKVPCEDCGTLVDPPKWGRRGPDAPPLCLPCWHRRRRRAA
jgi:predicted transcriptional regulator